MTAFASSGSGTSGPGNPGQTSKCTTYLEHCTPVGCTITGWYGADGAWYWQYNGCAPTCTLGGKLCCFYMNYTECT